MAALVKIGKILLVGFFAVTALSDFILKKKFNYVDELAASRVARPSKHPVFPRKKKQVLSQGI